MKTAQTLSILPKASTKTSGSEPKAQQGTKAVFTFDNPFDVTKNDPWVLNFYK